MSIIERMRSLLESDVSSVEASNALAGAINRLTFKYKGGWRNMTDAEAKEIAGLFHQMSERDQKYIIKSYKDSRDAMQKVVDLGKGFKGAAHQASDEDIVKDHDRMLKAFEA